MIGCRTCPSGEGGGIFLENGARFYVDCTHPEMTTPECANPWDVVRYMQAGERMLTAVAEEMTAARAGAGRGPDLQDQRGPQRQRRDLGVPHLLHASRRIPAKFPDQIIPHLVSRIIYSGAGGLELADGRLRFTLSPRVKFLEREVSGQQHE